MENKKALYLEKGGEYFVAVFIPPTKDKHYVLVNGWNKHKKFFTHEVEAINVFNSIKSAKCSVTKMIKLGIKYQLEYEKDDVLIIDLISQKVVALIDRKGE